MIIVVNTRNTYPKLLPRLLTWNHYAQCLTIPVSTDDFMIVTRVHTEICYICKESIKNIIIRG